jgi:hypothetical protein
MGVILVTCPNSGRDFSTGIQVEEDDFRNLPDPSIKSHCPHCGQEHQWRPSQARLIDALPATQWVESFARPDWLSTKMKPET